DGKFDKFFIRGEAKYHSFETGQYLATDLQAGVSLTSKIGIAFQRDQAQLEVNYAPNASFDKQLDLDYGVSIRYSLLPDLIIKGEVHKSTGFLPESPVANLFADKGLKTIYGIISVSMSF